jgi:caffeoyl-CoA O-methyltransferase
MENEKLQEYLNSLVPERPPAVQQMEAYAAENNFPIIGPAAGYFCYQQARILGARRVFELGSGYGYSTYWFARAVAENINGQGGEVFHTVWDEELSQQARGHLADLNLGHLVQYRVSEAVAALKETDGPFDLIFNDINKEGYPDSLPVIEAKLRSGGLLIIDNMIWSGRIFDDSDTSEATEGIREFTRRITNSDNWLATLVPIRDGLIVARKR